MADRILLPWEGEPPRSVALQIAARTARRIVEGSHPAGELLTEAALAQEAEASRTPAREAMLQLQTWGLVRLMPKKGAVVTAVSPAERRDLLDLRAMCETRAVEVLAERPAERAALVAALGETVDAQRDAVERGDGLGFAALDLAFHMQVIAAGGNQVVVETIDRLGPRYARMTHHAVAGDLAAARGFRAEHEDLARLVAAGDAAGYGATVRAHIAAAYFPGEAR
ncbi:GntR family transcriptional regulator [Puerhibacterium puerhi]|uniref:GntR family transcriptional regulator n=1 Tax=Puerhibacterium puerhi TaxID=2692623 RepID=UPI00135B05FD|nr:GntR family transcriptional regulator [Puerhibacterium puerhi]